MTVVTAYLPVETGGNGDIQDITAGVQECLAKSQLKAGILTLFSPSATSGITTLEYEPGCVHDLQRLFDEIIPPDKEYLHNQRWGDGNGHSHVRAALLKASLTVPFLDQTLILGRWQSIIFVDFDNRSRKRELILQILGE